MEELWNRTGRKGAEESRSWESGVGKGLLEKSTAQIKTDVAQIKTDAANQTLEAFEDLILVTCLC